MYDRHGKPIQPESDAPQTAAQLRAAIQNGELGPLVSEAGAAADAEQGRLAQQAAVRFACQMLEKMARELEQAESGQRDMQKRHAMMDTARSFRVSILWLLRPLEEPPAEPEPVNAP